MDGKYTRLKLKMLLLVVLGTVIAGAVGIFLLEVVIDGVLQDPFARFFQWAAITLFGQSEESALELYDRYIRANKQEILTVATMVLMLIAFYLAMGRFTRWLDDIRTATRRVVEDHEQPVVLPRELAPIQEDLNVIQRQLRAREEAARESEQRRGDLVAFLAHDLKTPLTSVMGYLTLLKDDPGLTPEQRAKYTGIASPSSCPCCWSSSPTNSIPSSRRRSSSAAWKSSTTWWCPETRTNLPGSSITY